MGATTTAQPAEAVDAPGSAPGTVEDDGARPGSRRTPRWWLVSVLAVTLVQLLVRWWSVMGLDSYHDDIAVTYRALDTGLTREFLLGTYAGHWGPLNRLLEWLTVHAAPFNPGVAFGAVLLILLIADVGMLLLLKRLVGPGRLSLVVYVFWACTPLMATTVGSWSLGLLLMPLVAGMAWTTWAFCSAVLDPSRRWQLATCALLGLTLLVTPQAIVLLVFLPLLVLAYPGLGGPARSRRDLLGRLWPLALGCTAVTVAYAIGYLSAAPTRNARSFSAASFGETIGNLGIATGVPSMLGGPWSSDPGALPSVGVISPFAVSVTIQLLVALVVLNVSMRRWAWRAWTLVAVMWSIQLVVVTSAVRADLIGDELLRQSRYLVPVLVPTCVLLAAGFGFGPMRPWFIRVRTARSWTVMAAGVTMVASLILAESAWYTNYEQAMAMKTASTATFWANVRHDLASQPAAAIVDRPMPSAVLFPGFLPDLGSASESLRYFVTKQRWDAPSDSLQFLRDDGHLVPAYVVPFGRSYPGVPGCGHLVRGRDWVTIPLNQATFNYGWGVHMNYLAAADTVLEAEASGVRTMVPVRKGVGSVTWVNPGTIPEVRLRSAPDQDIAVCVDQIAVGGLQPG